MDIKYQAFDISKLRIQSHLFIRLLRLNNSFEAETHDATHSTSQQTQPKSNAF